MRDRARRMLCLYLRAQRRSRRCGSDRHSVVWRLLRDRSVSFAHARSLQVERNRSRVENLFSRDEVRFFPPPDFVDGDDVGMIERGGNTADCLPEKRNRKTRVTDSQYSVGVGCVKKKQKKKNLKNRPPAD